MQVQNGQLIAQQNQTGNPILIKPSSSIPQKNFKNLHHAVIGQYVSPYTNIGGFNTYAQVGVAPIAYQPQPAIAYQPQPAIGYQPQPAIAYQNSPQQFAPTQPNQPHQQDYNHGQYHNQNSPQQCDPTYQVNQEQFASTQAHLVQYKHNAHSHQPGLEPQPEMGQEYGPVVKC